MPWQHTAGGADCNECNKDPLKPCSKYRCESLGTACGLANNTYEKENPDCVGLGINDKTAPIIDVANAETGQGYEVNKKEHEGIDFYITKSDDCVQEYRTINLIFQTNEQAKCVWSKENKGSYEEMEGVFEELNTYSKSHTLKVEVTGEDNFAVYFRCKDRWENPTKTYTLSTCISQIPDVSPPEITGTEPVNGGFIKYDGVTDALLKIYLNEPATCKYDFAQGKKYEEMTTLFTCEEPGSSGADLKYSCSKSFTKAAGQDFKIYIKCNDTLGNVMPNDEEYNLYSTKEQLKIDEIKIDKISASLETTTPIIRQEKISDKNPLILEATTSGGVDNGKAICRYKLTSATICTTGCSDRFSSDFDDTKVTNEHKQEFPSLVNKDYTFEVSCKDDVGNEITKTIYLKIDIDSTAPVLVTGSNIEEENNYVFETNEGAKCRYTIDETKNCLFDWGEEGTQISSESYDTIKHVISNRDKSKAYYVRCEDRWENKNSDCIVTFAAADTTPPELVSGSISSVGDDYKFDTNENAECKYTTDETIGCGFNWETEGTAIIGDSDEYDTMEHTIFNWNKKKTYYIRCQDEWENGKLSSECTHQINQETTTAPSLLRVYYDNGNLKLIIDQMGFCKYDFIKCGFTWNSGIAMTPIEPVNGNSIRHTTSWQGGKTYYIRCVNKWGDENTECIVQVLANSLIK